MERSARMIGGDGLRRLSEAARVAVFGLGSGIAASRLWRARAWGRLCSSIAMRWRKQHQQAGHQPSTARREKRKVDVMAAMVRDIALPVRALSRMTPSSPQGQRKVIFSKIPSISLWMPWTRSRRSFCVGVVRRKVRHRPSSAAWGAANKCHPRCWRSRTFTRRSRARCAALFASLHESRA